MREGGGENERAGGGGADGLASTNMVPFLMNR